MITFNLPVQWDNVEDGKWPTARPTACRLPATHPWHESPKYFLQPNWSVENPIMFPENLKLVYGLEQASDDLILRLWNLEGDLRPVRPVSAAVIPDIACDEFPDDPFVIMEVNPLEPGDHRYQPPPARVGIPEQGESLSNSKKRKVAEGENGEEEESGDVVIRPGDLWKACCLNHERVMRPQDCQLLARYYSPPGKKRTEDADEEAAEEDRKDTHQADQEMFQEMEETEEQEEPEEPEGTQVQAQAPNPGRPAFSFGGPGYRSLSSGGPPCTPFKDGDPQHRPSSSEKIPFSFGTFSDAQNQPSSSGKIPFSFGYFSNPQKRTPQEPHAQAQAVNPHSTTGFSFGSS